MNFAADPRNLFTCRAPPPRGFPRFVREGADTESTERPSCENAGFDFETERDVRKIAKIPKHFKINCLSRSAGLGRALAIPSDCSRVVHANAT